MSPLRGRLVWLVMWLLESLGTLVRAVVVGVVVATLIGRTTLTVSLVQQLGLVMGIAGYPQLLSLAAFASGRGDRLTCWELQARRPTHQEQRRLAEQGRPACLLRWFVIEGSDSTLLGTTLYLGTAALAEPARLQRDLERCEQEYEQGVGRSRLAVRRLFCPYVLRWWSSRIHEGRFLRPWLPWLLRQEGVWLGLTLLVGGFGTLVLRRCWSEEGGVCWIPDPLGEQQVRSTVRPKH